MTSRKSVAALVGAAIIGATLLDRLCSGHRQFVEMQGVVYAAFDPVRGPRNPIAGAVVSDDMDGALAISDRDGRFSIRVRRIADDEFQIGRAHV